MKARATHSKVDLFLQVFPIQIYGMLYILPIQTTDRGDDTNSQIGILIF